MSQCIKLAVIGMTGLIPLAASLLAAREPSAASGAQGEVVPAPETRLLIAHALGTAIDGTTAHLTARSIATLPDRKPDEAKGAIEAMRESARSSYQDGNRLFTMAEKRLGAYRHDETTRRLYDAAVAYTKTMWELTGEATTTTEKTKEPRPVGKLSVDDLASLEAINQTIRSAVGAFLLKQLTLRAKAPGNAAIEALEDHAGSMAAASKKASGTFPNIPESQLAEAKTKLAAAKTEKGTAKLEKAAAKQLEKVAKRLQSRAGTEASKGISESAKQVKKQAGEKEKEAKESKQKAEKAQAKEIGPDVRPSVRTLGQQGRALILLLDPMIEAPPPASGDEAKEKS